MGKLKHEVGREPFYVSFHGLVQCARCNLVQLGQISVQHDALTPYFVNLALDGLQFHSVGVVEVILLSLF